MKSLKQLCNEISEHLGIDPFPIKFEDMGQDDSRFYIKEKYVGINRSKMMTLKRVINAQAIR